jgi:hypothetical protein
LVRQREMTPTKDRGVRWVPAIPAETVCSVERSLEQHDWPGDEIAVLERRAYCFPTLPAKLVQLIGAQGLSAFFSPFASCSGTTKYSVLGQQWPDGSVSNGRDRCHLKRPSVQLESLLFTCSAEGVLRDRPRADGCEERHEDP